MSRWFFVQYSRHLSDALNQRVQTGRKKKTSTSNCDGRNRHNRLEEGTEGERMLYLPSKGPRSDEEVVVVEDVCRKGLRRDGVAEDNRLYEGVEESAVRIHRGNNHHDGSAEESARDSEYEGYSREEVGGAYRSRQWEDILDELVNETGKDHDMRAVPLGFEYPQYRLP